MMMPFGKYQGKEIENIPSHYLKWFCENIKPGTLIMENVIKACDDEYQFRKKYNCHFEELKQ